MTKRRSDAILDRWANVIEYGAIAGLVWYTFAPAITSGSAPLESLIASVPLWPRVAFWLAVGCVLILLVGRGRWTGLLGIRHFHSFPPLWVSVVLAATTAMCVNARWPRDPFLTAFTLDLVHATSRLSATVAPFLGALGIAGLAFQIIKHISSPHADEAESDALAGRKKRANWTEQFQSLDGLKKWALTDAEVAHPRQAMFDHDAIAQRMARRLADESAGGVPTMAVIGERGSGKSTIGRLVKHHLRSKSRILFVQLSLWPFESTDAAVRGILNELVRELGTRVSTLSLTGLPEQYAAAVEKLGPWAFVLSLFRQSPNPKQIIKQVDRIALATGLKIVLWIEDLERFSASTTIGGESAALREEERLGPIRSLLWLLNECEHIGVVVADATLRSRFDVDKIARFVEHIPPLDLDQAGEVLTFFRNECLNGYPKPVIDPVHPDSRGKFVPSEPLVRSMRHYMASDREPEPFDALIDVVRTPRSLKNVLRWTLETWEQLPGEVDLDHVIAASALRSSCPEVFEFLDTNVDMFRRGFQTAGTSENKPVEHPVYLAFQELLERAAFQSMAAPVRSLVRFIFPAYPQAHTLVDTDRQDLERPQGLNVRHDWIGGQTVDYWNRYLSCTPVPDDRSDQIALQQIKSWKAREESSLVSHLTDEARNWRIKGFLNQFRFTELLRLLTEVVGREGREGIDDWSEFLSPAGGVSVWNMLNRCGDRDSAKVASTLEELFQGLVPSHLPYARFLLNCFCVPGQSSIEVPLTDGDDTKRLSESVRRRLLASFPPGHASALRCALKGDNPYLLRNLLQDIKLGSGFTGDLPVEGWEHLSGTLLELAEEAPSVGIPIILTFVTSASDRIVDSSDDEGQPLKSKRAVEYQFQEERARTLFDWNRFRALLVEQCIPNDVDDWVRDMWSSARQVVTDIEPASLGNRRSAEAP